MKRLIFSLLLCLLLCGNAWAWMGAVGVGQGVPTAASGDSCTGNLLYSHHAENNDAADTNANGTQGCSASETYKAWAKTSTTYDSTAGYLIDGSYGIKSNGYNHHSTITTTGWMDLTSTGCVSMWYRGNGSNDGFLFDITIDSTHCIYGYYPYASGFMRLYFRDGTANTYVTASSFPSTGGWVQFGWDVASNLLQVRICDDAACSGESWTTKTDVEIVDIGDMPSAFWVGGHSGSSSYGWLDNVKIYSSSNCQ